MDQGQIENLIYKIIGVMIDVHKELGPGFLESVYRRALEIEFKERGFKFESEKEIEVYYKKQSVGLHRLDLLIEGFIVVELKAVEGLNKKHYAQVRSYLNAMNLKYGLLVNFSDFKLDPRRVFLFEGEERLESN